VFVVIGEHAAEVFLGFAFSTNSLNVAEDVSMFDVLWVCAASRPKVDS
jgi:hypothetical protein